MSLPIALAAAKAARNPKQTQDNIMSWVKFALLIIAVIVVIAIAWKIYKSAKAGGASLGATAGDSVIAAQTGIPQQRINTIREWGYSLWDDGVDGYRGWDLQWHRDFDEDFFIDILNRLLNVKEAALISEFYKERSGRSLKVDVNDAFNDSELSRVKSVILQNIF